MSSLEEKVLTQTGDVSKQAESTLQVLQTARKEILGNRQETAAFAQKFTSTLDGMSALLTQTVNAFSEQTIQLTKAIEKKEKSQSETLDSALADLKQEMAATRDAAVQAKSKAESVDQQLAVLGGQLQQMNQNLADGFITLTQLSRDMSQAIGDHLEQQQKSIDNQLADLRDVSTQSLESVREQLASLDQNTSTVQNNLARHIDAVGDEVRAGFSEQKEIASSIQNHLVESVPAAGALSQLAEKVGHLSSGVETGFSQGSKDREALRAALADLEYNLNGRTDNLLVELTAIHQKEDSSPTAERMAGVEGQLNSLAQGLQSLQANLGNQLAEAAQSAVVKGLQSYIGPADEKLVQAASHLKILQEQIQSVHTAVQRGIEATRAKAAEWMQNPQSEAAKNSFEAGLLEFANMMQSTQSQVETIQKQISGITAALSPESGEKNLEDGTPIGMAGESPQ